MNRNPQPTGLYTRYGSALMEYLGPAIRCIAASIHMCLTSMKQVLLFVQAGSGTGHHGQVPAQVLQRAERGGPGRQDQPGHPGAGTPGDTLLLCRRLLCHRRRCLPCGVGGSQEEEEEAGYTLIYWKSSCTIVTTQQPEFILLHVVHMSCEC